MGPGTATVFPLAAAGCPAWWPGTGRYGAPERPPCPPSPGSHPLGAHLLCQGLQGLQVAGMGRGAGQAGNQGVSYSIRLLGGAVGDTASGTIASPGDLTSPRASPGREAATALSSPAVSRAPAAETRLLHHLPEHVTMRLGALGREPARPRPPPERAPLHTSQSPSTRNVGSLGAHRCQRPGVPAEATAGSPTPGSAHAQPAPVAGPDHKATLITGHTHPASSDHHPGEPQLKLQSSHDRSAHPCRAEGKLRHGA